MEDIENENLVNQEVEFHKESLSKMAVTFLLLGGAFLLIAKIPSLIRAAVRLVHSGSGEKLLKDLVKQDLLNEGKDDVLKID
jgi:hypothetical protein